MSKMKHLLRKLHIGNDHHLHSNHHAAAAAARPASSQTASSPSPSSSPSESSSTSSSAAPGGALSQARPADLSDRPPQASPQPAPQEAVSSNTGGGHSDFNLYEEEFQVQLALALSASDNEKKKDPESDQMNAARQLSLGCPLSVADNQRLGEFLSLKYWNYNVVHYDEKMVNGFYDVYATTSHSVLNGEMPVLVDLQAATILDSIDYEVILVNRTIDPELRSLENKAYSLSAKCKVLGQGLYFNVLIQQIANLVVDRLGGPVGDAEGMTERWKVTSGKLRGTLNGVIFPLGLLDVGLSRHRALLFKVLADKINLPCMLVKGSLYTGSDDGAVNLVRTVDGSEYIIDLMGAPGALIPAEIPSSVLIDTVLQTRDVTAKDETMEDMNLVLDTLAVTQENIPDYDKVPSICRPSLEVFSCYGGQLSENNEPMDTETAKEPECDNEKLALPVDSANSNSPSVSGDLSPDQEKKVKDVSKYVINAAKNPEFAQKLHAVLLESGASPPPDLFTDMNPGILAEAKLVDQIQPTERNSNITALYWSNNELSLLPPSGTHPLNEISWDGKVEESAYGELASQQLPLVAKLVSNQTCSDPNGEGICPVTSEVNEVTPYDGTDESSNAVVPGGYNFEGRTGMTMSGREVGKTSNLDLLDTDIGCSTPAQGFDKNIDAVSEKEISPMLGEVAEWEIPWEDLEVSDRIGIGSYGEVYHGDWNGTEVAVKKFLVQDFTTEVLAQFKSEAEMMIRLRHPNVVLFMGAVTRPPNLSILTEFLPRGSLYKLLHRSNVRIDENRRMKMALDVAKGMNYLHTSHPTIVHRDLKTPNLLVDNNWVVKVCDFGLSRLKHHTFLSSKSTAGTLWRELVRFPVDFYGTHKCIWHFETPFESQLLPGVMPEWMAPEVLRNEPSNEKCDVYSFGVILWELVTMHIPWTGLNPMQVVGAVGFQNKRLEIPKGVDPVVTQIIHDCWQNDPSLRPSFSELITRLRGLKCLVRGRAQKQRP